MMTKYTTVNREYSIEEYSPIWVEKFTVIQKVIQNIFGNKALQIEHVGSTSMVGMKSKPIIDVLIIVENT